LSSKNNSQNISTTNKNTSSNIEIVTTSNKTGNKSTDSQNSMGDGDTRNYVSGDSAQSSSSHQFHRNASDKS
jgi:hypothetical protein